MSSDCFTLDDYIKKNNIIGNLNLRKKDLNIDKDELDASLDDIARKNAAKRGKRCGVSKFDRFNDDLGNQSDIEDSDDEEGTSSGSGYRKSYEKINTDMEMMDINEDNGIQTENSSIRFAKEIQQMEHPECCRIKKHFRTVESELGVKVKSQQWRVENPGSSKVLNGRIQKNYKKNGSNGPKAGIFIEKGNFTYKFNDDPSNDSEDNAESIVGIVRNRPVTKIIRVNNNGNNGYNNRNHNNNNGYNNFRNNRQNGNGSAPVNINMNWNGFFKGVTECIKTIAPATQPLERQATKSSEHDDLQVKIIAKDLFEFFKAKRDGTTNHKSTFPDLQRNDSIDDYIVSATAGNGIDMDVSPSVTNMPLNLRFA